MLVNVLHVNTTYHLLTNRRLIIAIRLTYISRNVYNNKTKLFNFLWLIYIRKRAEMSYSKMMPFKRYNIMSLLCNVLYYRRYVYL